MTGNVDLTILIPTLNEEITVGRFIDWCEEGFTRANVRGEIVLLDSSTDRTPEIATSKGARVVSVTEKGLGVAYLRGKNEINGKWVILGDADCTYDFRDLKPFLEKLECGSELVVGNRFRGKIARGSMPIHHRYFGSPATSFIFKHSLGIQTGDIHCGMRALTTELFRKLPFTELGWEYASEMIVSARNIGARISEVPINFYKEPDGRISHQRRNGWLTPFKAGWGTLRVTAAFSLDRLMMIPGLVLASLGVFANVSLLVLSPDKINAVGFGNLTSSLFGLFTAIGFLIAGLGVISHLVYYPLGKAVSLLAKPKIVNFTFSIFVVSASATFLMGALLFGKWNKGVFTVIQDVPDQTLPLVTIFNLVASNLIGLTSLLGCVFLASYMEKLRQARERD